MHFHNTLILLLIFPLSETTSLFLHSPWLTGSFLLDLCNSPNKLPLSENLPWLPLKSESEVAQSCLTLCDPMDSSLQQAPLSMGFSMQEYWSGLPFPSQFQSELEAPIQCPMTLYCITLC